MYALLVGNLRTSWYKTLGEAIAALRRSAADAVEEIGVGIVYTRSADE